MGTGEVRYAAGSGESGAWVHLHPPPIGSGEAGAGGPALEAQRQVISSMRSRATFCPLRGLRVDGDLVDHLPVPRAPRGPSRGGRRRCGTWSSTGR